jgi:hypothetical protein
MQDTYHTSVQKFAGTDYKEVSRKARLLYKEIRSKTKRKPYVRSVYFGKDKIFLDYFWQHLEEKKWQDRLRRLRYYACAIDLISYTRIAPTKKQNPNKNSEYVHRFKGVTTNKEVFFVQVVEKKNGNKHFISVFPEQS